MAMLVFMFMSHGLSVSIVKCTVLSCGSACVNQCPALPTASAMHTVTRFLSPQIQWTWMHPGCCTDPIPIIWVPRAHHRPGGSYHHLLTATVAPRLLQRPHPHHLGPESTSQTRRILPTPPDCLSRTQGAVTRGPTINHGLPSTPSPIWTLPALPPHELNCP